MRVLEGAVIALQQLLVLLRGMLLDQILASTLNPSLRNVDHVQVAFIKRIHPVHVVQTLHLQVRLNVGTVQSIRLDEEAEFLADELPNVHVDLRRPQVLIDQRLVL
ncbi:hypothetical protein D3C87_1239400 [compost metagenome]